jgi:hypothetical protein
VKKAILCFRFFFLAFATYGLFYFSCKYYIPWMGGNDFAHYRDMYLYPLDLTRAQAPFVYRQISAILTHIIYQTDVACPVDIVFSGSVIETRVFFAALLSNYLALLLTGVIVGLIIDWETGSVRLIPPMIGGLLCFASVFCQQSVITGLTEGWSWFLFAVGYYAYVRRSAFVVLVLLLSVVQRETISIVFAVIASVDVVSAAVKRKRDPYGTTILFSALMAFLLYFLMRTLLFPVPGHESQWVLADMMSNVFRFFPPSNGMVLHAVASQNLYFILVAVLVLSAVAKRHEQEAITAFLLHDSRLVHISCAIGVLFCVGTAAGIGNNIGRIAAIVTPAIAASIVKHLVQLEESVASLST